MLDTSSNVLGAYQGGSFAASRKWASENEDLLKGFIRGYLRGLEWTLDPTNREEASALLLQNMPEIRPQVAGAVMDSLLSPRSGLTPKAAMLMDGVDVVLDLRSRYGTGVKLTDASKYIDLKYYEAVLGR